MVAPALNPAPQPALASSRHGGDPPAALPTLTPREAELLFAYIQSGYSLAALSDPSAPEIRNPRSEIAPCSPAEFLSFITSPAIQAHLEAHFEFLHAATKCKATQTRQVAMDMLKELAPQATDPKEKRIVLQTLLRATSAPIVPPGNSPTRSPENSSPQRSHPRSEIRDPRSEMARPEMASRFQETEEPPPRPQAVPHAQTPPDCLGAIVSAALQRNDEPDVDSGLATIAEFLEHESEIDGEPVPGDDREESLGIVRDSNLATLTNFVLSTNHAGKPISDHHWTHDFVACTPRGRWSVHLELKRGSQKTSRYPGCFLITSINTTPNTKPP